jgi:hypothetical protein
MRAAGVTSGEVTERLSVHGQHCKDAREGLQ